VKYRYIGLISGGSALLLAGLMVSAAAVYTVQNKQHIADLIHVANFTPTASDKEQVKRSAMSKDGQFLFYASKPVVEEKADFNRICSAITIDTSILGCYLETSKQIILYHQTDKRLDGSEEVMAAHEMLRAAWDRMPRSEHTKLVTLLDKVLASNDDKNVALADRIKAIRTDDPADANAELYAIVGTEVPDVGTTLEKNYDQFFTKRATVTKLAAFARAYVVALTNQIDDFAEDLDNKDKDLDSRIKSFNQTDKAWKSSVDSFNRRASEIGGFASESQFNSQRAALVARQNALNAEAKSINSEIDDFNSQLKQLTALIKTAEGLVSSLNIELTPFTQLQAV
jgi:hypothetical protein